MYKISVMYPNQKDALFDFNYYQTKHMDLVKKHLQPFGLIKADVEKGISGGGDQPAPYIVYFRQACVALKKNNSFPAGRIRGLIQALCRWLETALYDAQLI